jgi:2',3'-cyclic-nucleotide 2'-phosphodiesterase (5'-nucleotidase family)
VVYLDAGGAAGGSSPYHREEFEAILAGEKRMGVAAHNLGKAELALGAEYLRDARTRLGVPFICANATDSAGAAIVPASVEISAGGRRVLVVGVVSPKFTGNGIKVTEPRQAILSALGEGKKSGRSIVVLAYVNEEELSALAASLPEVDAIIGGPTGQAVAPRNVGPVLLGAATNKGKFLITLHAPASGAWSGEVVEMNATYADAADQQQNVNDYIARLAKRDFSAAESGLVEALPAAAPADYRIAGKEAARFRKNTCASFAQMPIRRCDQRLSARSPPSPTMSKKK